MNLCVDADPVFDAGLVQFISDSLHDVSDVHQVLLVPDPAGDYAPALILAVFHNLHGYSPGADAAVRVRFSEVALGHTPELELGNEQVQEG